MAYRVQDSRVNTFHVKNFELYQHYKDRSPPWIKFHTAVLDDYDFGKLPDQTKWHIAAIWLLASRSENKLPYDPDWISRRINASEPVNLDALCEAGFIIVDQPQQDMEQVASKTPAKRLSRGEKRRAEETAPEILSEFEVWYAAYPRHEAKDDALNAYLKARKRTEPAVLLSGARGYAASPNRKPDFTKLPATWLNKGCWMDEREIARPQSKIVPLGVGG